jgi:hypothetical protein
LNTFGRVLFGFALPIGIGVAFLGYMAVRANTAKTHVAAFCNDVVLGSEVTGLAERAKEQGLSTHEFPVKEGKSMLLIEDGILLARHYCSLNLEQNHIVSKETSFVD